MHSADTLAHIRKGANRAHPFFKCFRKTSLVLQVPACFESSFVPKRVLIVTKISRYQIEKFSNPGLNEDQLKDKLIANGNNYDAILAGHQRNKATETRTVETLKHLNISYRIKDRNTIDSDCIDWADLIVPVGGDGTFLLASNLIENNVKPIIGINSDPEFSEGFLMLSPKYTNNIGEVFERLRSGNFKYLMRSRIRTTLHGENIWRMPFHMHDKNSCKEKKFYVKHHEATKPKGKLPKMRRLPWLALNEVFIGESLSARISILHIDVGDEVCQKVKSSGICVSTGTGSSSWYRAINALNPQVVEDVLTMAGCKSRPQDEIKKICFDFNTELQFPAEQLKLRYAIRDTIVKHTWPLPKCLRPRGCCEKMTIRSQCYDGGLVIDGGVAVHFNVGAKAVLETLAEDALRNIVLPD